MGDTQVLRLYNTLTRKKEVFAPIDPQNVRMYVCGPTVYDYIHIGNGRPIVVFDVLFRLLQRMYPRVSYVRNITDVEDKIMERAKENGESIETLTKRTTSPGQSFNRSWMVMKLPSDFDIFSPSTCRKPLCIQ